jgi:PKD repeat protein
MAGSAIDFIACAVASDNILLADTSTTFTFVDQTKGDITSRYWIWDDGTSVTSSDPDEHIATHVYTTAGEYDPNLLLVFADGKLKRISLNDTIIVS